MEVFEKAEKGKGPSREVIGLRQQTSPCRRLVPVRNVGFWQAASRLEGQVARNHARCRALGLLGCLSWASLPSHDRGLLVWGANAPAQPCAVATPSGDRWHSTIFCRLQLDSADYDVARLASVGAGKCHNLATATCSSTHTCRGGQDTSGHDAPPSTIADSTPLRLEKYGYHPADDWPGRARGGVLATTGFKLQTEISMEDGGRGKSCSHPRGSHAQGCSFCPESRTKEVGFRIGKR